MRVRVDTEPQDVKFLASVLTKKRVDPLMSDLWFRLVVWLSVLVLF